MPVLRATGFWLEVIKIVQDYNFEKGIYEGR